MRPKENAAKHPLIGADGVVVSSYPIIPNGFDNRWLETTTPSALNKERGRFSFWRSHPSFAKEGNIACHWCGYDKRDFVYFSFFFGVARVFMTQAE